MAWWFASPTALSITGTILLIWILWLVMSRTALGRGCFCIGAAVFVALFVYYLDLPPEFWKNVLIFGFPFAFALTIGMIIANREEKRKKAAEEARKERETERMEKSITQSIWLSEVEYWLTPKEIKHIPYLPHNIQLTAYKDDVTGELKEIRVIVDKQTVGLIPKELESEILPLIRENRITFATFPETYYNRKRCTGHVKMNLSYIPFESDYCLS